MAFRRDGKYERYHRYDQLSHEEATNSPTMPRVQRRSDRKRGSGAREGSVSGSVLGVISGSLVGGENLGRARRRAWKRTAIPLNRLRVVLSNSFLVGVVNLITVCILTSQTTSILQNGGRVGARAFFRACSEGNCVDLSHPIDIAARARMHVLPAADDGKSARHHAGYSSVKPGTFRSRYPSVSSDDVFDGIHVVTNEKCPGQWTEFLRRARAARLNAIQWPMQQFKQISLTQPPLPIDSAVLTDQSSGSKVVMSILKRQISYMEAHRSIWRHVVKSKRQRVLVVDDTVFPNERLLRILPSMFNQVDQESLAVQTSWHIVTLRRKQSSINASNPEPVWCSNPQYNHAVVRSNPSYGAGMYALSAEGARWLLDNVKVYRAPMDVEFLLLQRDFPEDFVVLSACNNDEPHDFCPEIAQDISIGSPKHQFECVWRRLQERRLAALAESKLS